jgi:hypothetical protein
MSPVDTTKTTTVNHFTTPKDYMCGTLIQAVMQPILLYPYTLTLRQTLKAFANTITADDIKGHTDALAPHTTLPAKVVVACIDGGGDAHTLDWSVVTHVFVSGGMTPWLLATAKANDVPVLGTFGCTWLDPPPSGCPDFSNATVRAGWVAAVIKGVAANGLAGLSIDIEGHAGQKLPDPAGMTAALTELRAAAPHGFLLAVYVSGTATEFASQGFPIEVLRNVSDLVGGRVLHTSAVFYSLPFERYD